MNCETCGGPTWNNAQKNQERVAQGKKPLPLWVCKDKDNCGWVKWPPKGQQQRSGGYQSGGNGAGPRSNGGGHSASSRPLGPLYNECLGFAKRAVTYHLPNAAPADIIAAAATLLIQASRDGSVIEAKREAPPRRQAPPPPPPVDDFEEFPDALRDEEDDLPF